MYINDQPVFFVKSNESEFLAEWRDHAGSLTDKLNAVSGSTELNVVLQDWTYTNWWERYFLKIKENNVFLREIIMKSSGVEYWYARTVIPQKCHDENKDFFKRLEQESIRNLIFGEDSVKRLNMICYPIGSENIEYHWINKYITVSGGSLWVRLAEYSRNNSSFYLIEILLPELENIS